MRLLHGVCTLVLIPLLWSLWLRRNDLNRWAALFSGAVFGGDGGGEQLDCGDGNGGGIRLARPRDAGLRGGGLDRLLPAGARSR